jgi:hypothetical protein
MKWLDSVLFHTHVLFAELAWRKTSEVKPHFKKLADSSGPQQGTLLHDWVEELSTRTGAHGDKDQARVRCGDDRQIENRFEAQGFEHRRSRGWCGGETIAVKLMFRADNNVVVSVVVDLR